MARSWLLTADERDRYAREGYLVRPRQFSPSEVLELIAASEALVADLVSGRHAASRPLGRLTMGSYVFEPDLLQHVTIKWEGDSDVVHGIEPCAHLSPALDAWAHDPRLIQPMIDIIGDDEPALFTEKLNLKRPHHGGANPLHQDHPYWVDVARDVDRVATAILFLDDADEENGCLEVVPGSHRDGAWSTRIDGDPFLHNEIDTERNAGYELRRVEVDAGSVVLFGPYLVHQSAPNRSDHPRRALLFSYQPGGHPHLLDFLRRLTTTGPG
jgi:hypothetical protein